MTASQVVEFVHTAPADMLLSANPPQSMPSLDVPGSGPATLRAKVVDVKGNPVAGENVTFAVRNIDAGEFVQVTAPYLSASSARTDDDGYAAVRFYPPGTFTTDRTDPRWSAAARGGCNVVATWNDTTRTIPPLAWENYPPFLSVEAEVSPGTVAVNDTVDVTIRLKGDGWALRPDPIDVVICTDRSGEHALRRPPRPDALGSRGGKAFVDQFSENHDRAAAASFGCKGSISRPGANSGIGTHEIDNDYTYPKTYDDYATLDLGLTRDLPAVKGALDGIVPRPRHPASARAEGLDRPPDRRCRRRFGKSRGAPLRRRLQLVRRPACPGGLGFDPSLAGRLWDAGPELLPVRGYPLELAEPGNLRCGERHPHLHDLVFGEPLQ